jgi:Ca-activated chloride channel family protein
VSAAFCLHPSAEEAAVTFRWPEALWGLAVLPALAGIYLLLLRRRVEGALRYPALRPVRAAMGYGQLVRRHAPALALLLALVALLVAAARPAAVMTAPAERGTVVLAMDVSLSMAATDVAPTRLGAAQAAARAFIDAQPGGVLIGLIAFAGHAEIVQAPTANRSALMAALAGLEFRRYTSIGNGLAAALLALHPEANPGAEYDIFGDGRRPPGLQESAIDRPESAEPRRARVARGSDPSSAIVIVSDGQGALGVPHMTAARMAAERGVRVYAIGIGTLYGGAAHVEGMPPVHAEFEEDTLRNIAEVTGGDYFSASSADKVKRVYEKLATRVVFENRENEMSALFAALGAALWLGAAALSLAWCNLPSR